MNAVIEHRDLTADTRYTHVLYALHALAPFTAWIFAAIAVVMGMIKRDDVRGTYLDSHFSWLSRTFWWGLLWIVVASIVTFILVITVIGVLVAWTPFVALFIWYLYRVIKGWLRLNDRRPVE